MIKMVVRVDNETDRFARTEFFCFGQHERGTTIVQRAFNHHQVVFHFYRHAVMRSTGQMPHAIGYFDGNHVFSKCTDKCGHFNASGDIDLDLIDH